MRFFFSRKSLRVRLAARGLAIAAICMLSSFVARSAAAQLTVAALIGPIVEDPQDARYGDITAAIEQFMQGDVEGTQTLLAEAVGKNADLPPAEVLLAAMFFSSGERRAAQSALEQASETTPGDPEAYLLLGDIALAESRFTEADLLYHRASQLCAAYEANALRKRRMQIGAYSGLAAVAASRRRWNDVASAVAAWLKLDPDSLDAQTRWGRVLFHQGDTAQAYAVLQKAHQQHPQSTSPEITMGLLYEELVQNGDATKRENAKRAMQTAVERDPDRLDTRLAVARWALAACEIEIAESSAAAALKLNADSLEAKFMVGLAARHRGNLDAALTAFESAHLQSPGDSMVINQLALVLAERNDDKQLRRALEYAQLNLAANPDRNQPGGIDAAITLAWILFQSGRSSEAQRTVQSAVAAGGSSDDGAYYAAVILADAGQNEAALRLLRPVLQSGRCFVTKTAAQKLLDGLRAAGS